MLCAFLSCGHHRVSPRQKWQTLAFQFGDVHTFCLRWNNARSVHVWFFDIFFRKHLNSQHTAQSRFILRNADSKNDDFQEQVPHNTKNFLVRRLFCLEVEWVGGHGTGLLEIRPVWPECLLGKMRRARCEFPFSIFMNEFAIGGFFHLLFFHISIFVTSGVSSHSTCGYPNPGQRSKAVAEIWLFLWAVDKTWAMAAESKVARFARKFIHIQFWENVFQFYRNR